MKFFIFCQNSVRPVDCNLSRFPFFRRVRSSRLAVYSTRFLSATQNITRENVVYSSWCCCQLQNYLISWSCLGCLLCISLPHRMNERKGRTSKLTFFTTISLFIDRIVLPKWKRERRLIPARTSFLFKFVYNFLWVCFGHWRKLSASKFRVYDHLKFYFTVLVKPTLLIRKNT